MPKGQTFTPPDSKRGRQYTAAKGTGSRNPSDFIGYSEEERTKRQNQEAWNRLQEAQKEAKKKLQSAG